MWLLRWSTNLQSKHIIGLPQILEDLGRAAKVCQNLPKISREYEEDPVWIKADALKSIVWSDSRRRSIDVDHKVNEVEAKMVEWKYKYWDDVIP
jgi:hypothetical protein